MTSGHVSILRGWAFKGSKGSKGSMLLREQVRDADRAEEFVFTNWFFTGETVRETVTLTDSFSATGGYVLDNDAAAFLGAAGITDRTITVAINNLVLSLKAANIWVDASALYPFVGGTASTHKFNLKNPLDADPAFRLNFFGGWTHASTGALPNSTTGYANSFWNPSVLASSGLLSMGVYSRTNYNVARCDMGVHNASDTQAASVWCWFDGNLVYGLPNTDNIATGLTISSSDSRGWFFTSRTDSTNFYVQKDSGQTAKTSSVGVPNNNVYIGARNVNNTADFFSNRELAFAWIGTSLTTGEGTTLNNIVRTFQSELGRQIGSALFDEKITESVTVADSYTGDVTGGSGTTYNDSLSDGVTVTDSYSNVSTYPNTLSNPVTAGDSLTSVQTFGSTLTETTTLGESESSIGIFGNSLSETTTLSDSYVGGNIFASSLSDGVTLSDSITNVITFIGSLTESTTTGQTVVTIMVMPNTLSDGVTLTDNYVGGNIFESSLSDGVTLSDSISNLLTLAGLLSESLTPGDSSTTSQTFVSSLGNIVTVSDTEDSLAVMGNLLSNGVTLSDDYVGGSLFTESLSSAASVGFSLSEYNLLNELLAEGITVNASYQEGQNVIFDRVIISLNSTIETTSSLNSTISNGIAKNSIIYGTIPHTV